MVSGKASNGTRGKGMRALQEHVRDMLRLLCDCICKGDSVKVGRSCSAVK
jgi:hypothetical protein